MSCRDLGLLLICATTLCACQSQPPETGSPAEAPAEERSPSSLPSGRGPASAVPEVGEAATVGESDSRPSYVAPLRGAVDIGYLSPVTKVEGDLVITTIDVRNLSSTGSIAGLKVEEFWWDKAGNPVIGSSHLRKDPLMPGDVATVRLETPKDPRMHRNNYRFSHRYGKIRAKRLKEVR